MQATDKADFTALIAKTWRFYGKQPTGEDVADWFELLAEFSLGVVATAFRRHLTDPQQGQYLPKPADIVRHLPIPKPEDDGRPSPDEAWGMLLRVILDEAETGVLTDEMRTGWEVCGPILSTGDKVGARKCFLAAYSRASEAARQARIPPRWTVTLGTDPRLRDLRLQEAITAQRLSHDHAVGLLTGPAPVAISQVAGLLEGPDATPKERDAATRLRRLAGILSVIRAGSEEDERERQTARDAERQARMGRETAARHQAMAGLEQRQVKLPASHHTAIPGKDEEAA